MRPLLALLGLGAAAGLSGACGGLLRGTAAPRRASVHSPQSTRFMAGPMCMSAAAGSPHGRVDLIQALTDPDRLDALTACDRMAVSYNPSSFFSTVFYWRGRNPELILPPLFSLLVWGVTWSLLLLYAPRLRATMSALEVVSRSLLPPVSFLLVFRIGRAAARFWDARKSLGQLIVTCRTAASTTAVAFHSRPDQVEEFNRWLAVFPIVVKNFLRSTHDESRAAELRPLLSDGEVQTLLSCKWSPIIVLDNLRQLAFVGTTTALSDPSLRSQCYRSINSAIDKLTDAWGAMERIDNTPLPFAYVGHLRTILMLYLYVLSLTCIAQFGAIVLPGVLASSWALLGIEAAAVECSSPFQNKPNHLRIGTACVVIAECMALTLQNAKDVDRVLAVAGGNAHISNC